MANEHSLICLYDDDAAYRRIYCLKSGQPCDFMEVLPGLKQFEQDKIIALIEWAAKSQSIYNRQKSRQLRGDIYEFKQDQFRMPYFYHHVRHLVVITHMFRKKSDKCPHTEITRAEEKKQIADDLMP